MVAGIIIAAGLALVFFFGTGIGQTIGQRVSSAFKSAAELELEQKEREEAKERSKQIEGKGAIGNTLDFLLGEGFVQKEREKNALIQKQNAIKVAEAKIEKQAKDAGFDSIADFNRATDSGSVVIGGSRNVVDFGRIGDPSEFAVQQTTRGQKRFGGKR